MKFISILFLVQAATACQLLDNPANFNGDSWDIAVDSETSISKTPRASLVFAPREIGEKLSVAHGFDSAWQESHPRLIRITARATDTFSLEIALDGRVFKRELKPGRRVHEFRFQHEMPYEAQMKLTFISRDPSSLLHLDQIELRTTGLCYPDNAVYGLLQFFLTLVVILSFAALLLCCRREDTSPKQGETIISPEQRRDREEKLKRLNDRPFQGVPLDSDRLTIAVVEEHWDDEYYVCYQLVALPMVLCEHAGFYANRTITLEDKYDFVFSDRTTNFSRLNIADDPESKRLKIKIPMSFRKGGLYQLHWQKFSSRSEFEALRKRLKEAVEVFNRNLDISNGSLQLGRENLITQRASDVFGETTLHSNE